MFLKTSIYCFVISGTTDSNHNQNSPPTHSPHFDQPSNPSPNSDTIATDPTSNPDHISPYQHRLHGYRLCVVDVLRFLNKELGLMANDIVYASLKGYLQAMENVSVKEDGVRMEEGLDGGNHRNGTKGTELPTSKYHGE